MHKTRLYNTLIQHIHQSQIQHKVHTTCLYNKLTQNEHFRKMLTSRDTHFDSSLKQRKGFFLNKISYNTESKTHIQDVYKKRIQ